MSRSSKQSPSLEFSNQILVLISFLRHTSKMIRQTVSSSLLDHPSNTWPEVCETAGEIITLSEFLHL
jgi:hypothetical protein